MDLEEARADIAWKDKRIASLTIANNQLKAQITSLKNELADVLEDVEGMRMLFEGLKDSSDDDDGSNHL
jgi:predicted  nucleic acid-binding Zn-ribbon protein